MRQFQSASGRRWSVEVERVSLLSTDGHSPAEAPAVLRFNSPGLTCDLREWPADWEQLPESQILSLLDRALTEWVSSPRT